MKCLLPYLCMVTVPHIMVGLERMLDYRGVRLVRFHCNSYSIRPNLKFPELDFNDCNWRTSLALYTDQTDKVLCY